MQFDRDATEICWNIQFLFKSGNSNWYCISPRVWAARSQLTKYLLERNIIGEKKKLDNIEVYILSPLHIYRKCYVFRTIKQQFN